jgi:hypothetical protein
MRMNPMLKSILTGLLVGFAPLTLSALLFYSAPYLVDGNPETLQSFAVKGLLIPAALTALIFAIILIAKKKASMGITALLVLVLQAIGTFLVLTIFTGYSS